MDFSRYQPPGVYVEDLTAPMVQTPDSAVPTTIAILGPSRGYRTFSETVVLDGEDPVELGRTGINQNTIEVRGLDGSAYIEATDYVLDESSGEGGDLNYTPDNVTTIARNAAGDINNGESVTVSYQYADESFFEVQKFNDMESVRSMFGRPFDPETGAIISPLSMAARLAFDNGANEVALLDINADDPESVDLGELESGFLKFAQDPDIGIVVPLPVGAGDGSNVSLPTSMAEALQNHVEVASADRNYRIGIFGFERAITSSPVEIAQEIESERVVVAYPNRMLYYNGATNSTVEVAGYYLAAAYAGQFIRNGTNQPLTGKRIRGFAGLPGSVINEMTRSTKNTYSSRGVAVTEVSRNQQLVCRHGVSTNMQNVLVREPSIVRARDVMLIRIESGLESARLVGSAITANTGLQVKSVVAGALEASKDDETIIDYRDLLVRQVSMDPTLVQVRFEYKPAYPLNYILISFAVDVTTGEVAEDANLEGLTV